MKSMKFFDYFYKSVKFMCTLILVVVVLITSLSIASRYVPFLPSVFWAEEVILLLMAYMALMSASLAIRTRSHMRVTGFDKYLSPKMLKGMDIVADLGILLLALVMIFVGWGFATDVGRIGTLISLPNVSSFWRFFSVPLAGLCMLVFSVEIFIKHLTGVNEYEVE